MIVPTMPGSKPGLFLDPEAKFNGDGESRAHIRTVSAFHPAPVKLDPNRSMTND
jgi:hypothetical protein